MARKSLRRKKIMEAAQDFTRFNTAINNFVSIVKDNDLGAAYTANVDTTKRIKELGVDILRRESFRYSSAKLSVQAHKPMSCGPCQMGTRP